jgi:hypothetical protein
MAGTYEKGKHTRPELRKVQDPELHKKPDCTWTRVGSRAQSDAELQEEVQLRFTKLGGEGIVSPQKAVALCRNTTTFFRKDTKAGVKAVNVAKSKRWRALLCHVHHRR